MASFAYSPTKCRETYRVVVVRKNRSVARGEQALFDDVRLFFSITNDRLLGWNRWLPVFFRAWERVRMPLQC